MALYHSLNQEVLFLKSETAARIIYYFRVFRDIYGYNSKLEENHIPLKIVKDMIRIGLLISADIDERQVLNEIVNKAQKEQCIRVLILTLTFHCNLKCTYCCEGKPIDHDISPVMSEKVMLAAINMFVRVKERCLLKQRKIPVIKFYGGEPFLNYRVMKRGVQYVQKLKEIDMLPNDTRMVVVTNGTLLDDEKVEFLAEHDIDVVLSLDGYRETNNKHRLSKDGFDVFALASRSLELCKKGGIHTDISCTMTPSVLDNFDQVVNFFLENLGDRQRVHFNSLHFNYPTSNEDAYFQKESQCILQALPKLQHQWQEDDRVNRTLKVFGNKEIIYAGCAGAGQQVVVIPNGQIGPCEVYAKAHRYFTASVFDHNFDPLNDHIFQEWRNRSPLNMPQCFECEALGVCGGGCPINAEDRYGSIWEVDKRICHHSRLLIEHLAWREYEKRSLSALP